LGKNLKIEFYPEKCTGCRICEMACSIRNEGVINPSKARLRIYREAMDKYTIKICNLCGECIKVCNPKAIYIENGVFKVNDEKCNMCLKCLKACPQEAIFIHKDLRYPLFCIFCGACVANCPQKALALIR
jgi:Fe-S-cluster-containing hydrogenase component 2